MSITELLSLVSLAVNASTGTVTWDKDSKGMKHIFNGIIEALKERGVMVVDSVSALAHLNGSDAQLVLVKGDAIYKFNNDASAGGEDDVLAGLGGVWIRWTSIKGDKGDKGDTGATGPAGPTGAAAPTITNMAVDGSNHLIVTLSNDTTYDAGAIPVPETAVVTIQNGVIPVTDYNAEVTDCNILVNKPNGDIYIHLPVVGINAGKLYRIANINPSYNGYINVKWANNEHIINAGELEAYDVTNWSVTLIWDGTTYRRVA